jgi:hypothetical protein
MKVFEMKMHLLILLAVICCLLGIGSQVAQAQTYTSDTNIAHFTAGITSYATLSHFNNSDGCGEGSFTPTSSELATTGCRVYNGTLTVNDSSGFILATFTNPVSTIVVFPNIDHYGSGYDGYQYQIYGSNDYGSSEFPTWTPLFNAVTVTNAGEPFRLGTFTGTPPSTVNNVLTPQSVGLPAGCSSPNPPPCSVGYIASFNFSTAYKYYAFGTSTLAGSNAEQELSAVGASSTQTKTLGGPGTQTIYTFGADNYKIIGLNNQGGEQLTITAFPIPKSSFPTGETGIPGFTNETCIPYGDFSTAAGVDTCVEFQATCMAANNTTCNFVYLLATSYDLTGTTLAETGAGGPDFLVAHGVNCPLTSNSIVQSIFTSYSAMRTDPTTRGTSRGPSCFVAMYTPGATPITTGTFFTSKFTGWESPVSDFSLNQLKAGSARPLVFQYSDALGNPVTNLSLCNAFTSTSLGNVCTDSPTVLPPWVNLTSFGVACSAGAPVNLSTDGTVDFPGNSGLLNHGGGNYQLNWKSMKNWKGFCANVTVTFDTGQQVVPATLGFQFN